jgi:hypothetical protein
MLFVQMAGSTCSKRKKSMAYIRDDMDWVHSVDHNSVKDYEDTEIFHNLKCITNNKNDAFTYHEIQTTIVLSESKDYHVVYVAYDYDLPTNTTKNLYDFVAILDNPKLATDLIEQIKEDLNQSPEFEEGQGFDFGGEFIESSRWKDEFTKVKNVTSVVLKFNKENN